MNIAQYKKYALWGIAGIAVLLIVGTLLYSLFFKQSTSGTNTGGIFPAGDTRTGANSTDRNGQSSSDSQNSGDNASLFQMHDRPVVSSVLFTRGADTYARFMEQGSGHVYEYDMKNRREYRISNTSVPQIAEAFWSQDGTVVAFRYEDGGTLKAAVGELATTTEERAFLKVHFLPEGIRSLALSPDGKNVFYIISGSTLGNASGIVAARDGSSPRIVFTSKLPRWFVSWPSTTSLLVSSPWSSTGGIAYRIDLKSGAQTPVFSTTGLFVGITGGPRGELLVTDPSTNHIATLSRTGVPEPELAFSWPSQCSFSSGASSTAACSYMPKAGVPIFAEWSRGEYDMEDNLMIFDFSSGLSLLALSQDEIRDRVFDITNVTLSPDASYASFKNRVDGLPWGVVVRR